MEPERRYVRATHARAFSGGGAKFRTGDTLLARITPCLENGKIAQFAGSDGDVGFGSTEFFASVRLGPLNGQPWPGRRPLQRGQVAGERANQ